VRAGYLGSTTNQIMVLSTFLPLVAGRFGLAPTSTRHTTTGLKLLPEDKSTGLYSADPAGEAAVVLKRRWGAGMGGWRGMQLPVAVLPC
jgi:photosystem I subunit 10